MWRSGGVREARPDERRVRAFSVPTVIRLVVTLAVVAGVVILVFPLVFELEVDVPEKVQFSSASAVMFQITNQDLTAVTDVEYRCEVARFVLTNGSAVKDANVLSTGRFSRIGSRSAVRGRCQTAYLIAAPLQTAEFQLTITYRANPWRRKRTRVLHIAAQFDSKHEVTGWKAQ